MKNLLPLMLITLVISSACDSPRSQRALSSTSSKLSTNSLGNTSSINLDNSNSSTSNITSTTGTSVIPTDASHCKFATDGVSGFESTSSHLGDHTLCQSSSDKNSVYFQLKTSTDTSICFIPTTNNGSNSIYVGNPMCGYFKDPKSVRKITFTKYSSYANSSITGVMVFKDQSYTYPIYYKHSSAYYAVYNASINTLDAYILCMNMIADLGNTTNCTYFKNLGQYVFKQF